MVHGNQAVLPGHETQNLINDNQGAGYHRVIDAHAVFRQPLNLHVTPTLAIAMQWAAANPIDGTPWRDGPAFNQRIGALVTNGLISLLGSTFSDHAMPYFPADFHADNEQLAREVLTEIYGATPSTRVFWLPERLADDATLQAVSRSRLHPYAGRSDAPRVEVVWSQFGTERGRVPHQSGQWHSSVFYQ